VEQEIHFCGRPGRRIAYALVGQGPPHSRAAAVAEAARLRL